SDQSAVNSELSMKCRLKVPISVRGAKQLEKVFAQWKTGTSRPSLTPPAPHNHRHTFFSNN
ncbi:hypothetical protein RRG08_064796, partial [Elysia crispata]